MTVVSSKEFACYQDKYYNLAINEQVCIKRGKNMFQLICINLDGTNVYDRTSAEKREKLNMELKDYLIDLSSFKFDREEANTYE